MHQFHAKGKTDPADRMKDTCKEERETVSRVSEGL